MIVAAGPPGAAQPDARRARRRARHHRGLRPRRGVRPRRRRCRSGRAGGRGLRRVGGPADDRPREHRARRPGRHQLEDRELPRLSRPASAARRWPAGRRCRRRSSAPGSRSRAPSSASTATRSRTGSRSTTARSIRARADRHRHRRALPQARRPGLRALRGPGHLLRGDGDGSQPLPGEPRWSSSAAATRPGQAAVFLSRTARHVHVLVRGAGLAATMSDYLVQRIERSAQISLHPHCEIIALEGDDGAARGRLDATGRAARETTKPVSAIFAMIGAEPNTDWVDGCLDARRARASSSPAPTRRPGRGLAVRDLAARRLRRRRRPLGLGQARRLGRRRRLGRGAGDASLPPSARGLGRGAAAADGRRRDARPPAGAGAARQRTPPGRAPPRTRARRRRSGRAGCRTATAPRPARPAPAPSARPGAGRSPAARTGPAARCPWRSSGCRCRRRAGSRTAPPAGAPSSASRVAPTGCISAASRAESSGWTWRSTPNSSSRPPTCAGPTSAPIATAAARVAPPACSRRGRCAAIAVLTNQVTAKTKARISAARRRPARRRRSATRRRRATGRRRPRRGRAAARALSGTPSSRCSAGPGEAGAAPADLRLEQRRERPADGAGEAGDQRDAGDQSCASRGRSRRTSAANAAS